MNGVQSYDGYSRIIIKWIKETWSYQRQSFQNVSQAHISDIGDIPDMIILIFLKIFTTDMKNFDSGEN